MWRFGKEILAALIALSLVGCGGGSSSEASSGDNFQNRVVQTQKAPTNSKVDSLNIQSHRGYYLDSEVKGIDYECGEFNGKTSGDGLFLFEEGKGCTFSIGDVVIKTIPEDKLFDGVTILEKNITIARVLQTMDIDNNPKNGIDIEEEAKECLKESLPKSEEDFDSLVECLNNANIPDFVKRDYAVTADEAKDHIEYTKDSLVPVAKSFTVGTTQNMDVEINILAQNPRNDMLTYKIISSPKNGTLSGKAPNLIYTPNPSFTGVDSFSYVVSNRRFSSEIATITIEVTPKKSILKDSALKNNAKTLQNQIVDDNIFVDASDRVVVYQTSKISSNSDLTTPQMAKITKDLYTKFRDDFDFIFVISDSNRDKFSYFGLYFGVKNDTDNLGNRKYDYTSYYGSKGRLQGIVHFPSVDKFQRGPKLHELLHRWANSIIDVKINGKPSRHWGYNGFDKRGQLGGFEINTLKVEKGSLENGGIFSARLFGSNANGGDSLPYNKIELYLMGLISADEVGDIMISKNAKYIQTNGTRVEFSADSIQKISFTEYLNKIGLKPRARNNRESYKVLTVILTNKTPSQTTIDKVSKIIKDFGKDGSDGNDRIYNLYEATNGKLHLEVSNISDSIK